MDPSFVVKGLIIGDDNCYVFDKWQEISDLNTSGQNVFNIKFTTPEWYENNKYKYVDNYSNLNNSIILNKNSIEVGTEDVDGVTNYYILDSNIGKAKVNDFSEDKNYIAVHNTFDKEDIYTLEIKVVAEDVNNESD